jgi:hypothetical protein
MPQKQVSPERKTLYYVGMVLTVVGFLTFGSTFVSAAANFGDFTDFQGRSRSMFTRAVFGMGMIIVGGILANIGKMGLAGSGIILDPEDARRDVEPWSRMTGGVVKDALDEAGIQLGTRNSPESELPFDERLRRLQKLHNDGLINEQEYDIARKKILDSV